MSSCSLKVQHGELSEPHVLVHALGIEPLFLMLNVPSIAAMAEKDQQLPHRAWFLIGGTTPCARQSQEAGATSCVDENVSLPRTVEGLSPSMVVLYSSFVMSA